MASTMESSATAVNPISKKISKILESKIETDKEMLEALQTTSSIFTENSLKTRRNLRRDIEKRSLDINREFLENFRKVKEELETVSDNVSSMSRWCKDMNDRLQATKSQTRDLLDQTTKLQNESKLVEKRAEIARAFVMQFQLQPNEVKALRGTMDGSVTKDFFTALARTKEIHNSCKDLLLSGQHAAGLEIMNTMATYQENAYELLYRWVQREFRLLNVDAVEINPLLCEAVKALQERPILLKYAFDEFCIARRSHVVKAFIDALTKGGPGGIPKPIELLSHDPLRYIGDMLAWVHQAFASEKELATSLLRMCAEEISKENLPVLLSQTMDGLCRPFKIRVEQVLGGEHGPVILYKLANLFIFYYEKIAPNIVENSAFVYAINELKELLTNMFFSSLNSNVGRLLGKLEVPGPDLLPVPGLHQVLLLLRDVLESHDSTLVPVENKKENYSKIFGAAVDPLFDALLLSSTQLDAVSVAVYLMNCLHSIYSILALYQYADQRLEMLQAQMDVHIDVLVSEQAAYMLSRIGMMKLYNTAMHHQPNQGPLSSLPGMDAANVKNTTVTVLLIELQYVLTKPPNISQLSGWTLSDATDACSLQERLLNRVYITELYQNFISHDTSIQAKFPLFFPREIRLEFRMNTFLQRLMTYYQSNGI